VALILAIVGGFFTGQIYLRREVDYRDALIAELKAANVRAADLFQATLATYREEVLPALASAAQRRNLPPGQGGTV
jgi:hypothetical protein